MTTALWLRLSWVALAGVEDEVNVSRRGLLTIPGLKRSKSSSSRTGCDSLAIAIGTSHGAYKFTADQCTRNEKGIWSRLPCASISWMRWSKRLPGFPIVLHGSSSVPQEYVKMINENGGKMPDAVGYSGRAAAPGRPKRSLQDQHRLRSASGHDGHHPPVLCGAP